MYQNFMIFWKITHPCVYISRSTPIHVPKFHDLGGKWLTHARKFSFQNPSMYIDHAYPWQYVSTPPGYPASPFTIVEFANYFFEFLIKES